MAKKRLILLRVTSGKTIVQLLLYTQNFQMHFELVTLLTLLTYRMCYPSFISICTIYQYIVLILLLWLFNNINKFAPLISGVPSQTTYLI